jgi:hypothetical protein
MSPRPASPLSIALLLLSACSSSHTHSGPAAHPATPDARPEGGTHHESDHVEPEFEVRERWGARPVPPTPSAVAQMDVKFSGRARGAAKTSIAAAATVEEFATLDDLLDSLPPDDVMASQRISSEADRVPEEVRNVKVRGAWLYAARIDDDQDVRLIIGTDPRTTPRFYLAAVATALPPTSAAGHDALRAAREDVFEALGHRMPGRTYGILNPPVRIQISGSLLYDVEQSPGATAPQRFRPATAWQIHPITSLQEP